MVDGTRLDYKLIAQPYTPVKQEFIDVVHPSATTAELASLTSRVNIKDKFAGKIVFNSTAGILVFTAGATAASVWNGVHDNLLDHTPI